MPRKILIGFAAGLFLAMTGAGPLWVEAQEQGRENPSIDDMLEYTVRDLNSRLKDLMAENQRLSARNNAIRKRMLFLKEESRRVEKEKIKAREDYLDFTQEPPLDAKDYFSSENREMMRQERQIEVKKQQGPLRRRLEKEIKEQQKAEEQVLPLRQELEKIEKEKKLSSSSKRRTAGQKRSHEARDLVQQVQIQVKQRNAQKKAYEEKLRTLQRERDPLIERNKALERQLALVQKELLSEKEQEQSLNAASLKFEDRKNQDQQKVKKDIQQLSFYKTELMQSLDKLKDVRDEVIRESSSQIKVLSAFPKAAERQRRLFVEYTQGLNKKIQILENQKENLLQPDDRALEEFDAMKAKDQEEHKGLLAALDQEQKLQQSLRKEVKQVQDEMDAFKARLNKAEEVRPGGDKKSIARYKEAGKVLQRNIEEKSGRIDQLRKAVAAEKKSGENLHKELKSLESEREEIGQEQKNIPEKNTASLGATEALNQEIDALKTRTSLLSASIPVIRSRLDIDGSEAKEFQEEENQLQEYLAALAQENLALKDKVLSLTQAIRILEDKKILLRRSFTDGKKE